MKKWVNLSLMSSSFSQVVDLKSSITSLFSTQWLTRKASSTGCVRDGMCRVSFMIIWDIQSHRSNLSWTTWLTASVPTVVQMNLKYKFLCILVSECTSVWQCLLTYVSLKNGQSAYTVLRLFSIVVFPLWKQGHSPAFVSHNRWYNYCGVDMWLL